MVNVIYIDHEGERTEIEAQEGWTLMQTAVSEGVDGIDAECGGSCCCATCHVYIDDGFLSKLKAASSEEDQMLDEVASERKPNSRLSCQLTLTEDLDGIVVHIPEEQA